MRPMTTVMTLALLSTAACSPSGDFEGLEPPALTEDERAEELEQFLAAADAGHAPDGLVITEVLRNPDAVSDARGEWFEVQNQSLDPIDLHGLEVRDSGGTGFVVEGSVLLQPFDYAVIARNGDPTRNGGVGVHVDWPGSFSLANAGDDIELHLGGRLHDRVVLTGPAPAGVAEQVAPDARTPELNDDAANWCEATTPFGAGDLGTPGAPNPSCAGTVLAWWELEPGDLAITEVMRNPDAVRDSSGEWFEVHNTTDQDIDLDGVEFRDSAGTGFTVEDQLIVSAGGYVVLGQSADTSANGGAPVDYAWPGSLTLRNGDDDLMIDVAGTQIDAVAWDADGIWPSVAGAAMQFAGGTDIANDNDDGAAWCAATESYGDGDLGTPGAANPTCPEPPEAPGSCDTYVPIGHSIQDAIVAANDGEVVCLEAGTYIERIDFSGKDITLRGAGVGQTQLSGDEAHPIVAFENGESPDAVLEQVTLLHGSAEQGGSIYLYSASPTIRDVEIRSSWCAGRERCRGAAIYADGSEATFSNVVVRDSGVDNTQYISGGFEDIWGGLLFADDSHLTLTDVTFENNHILPWNSSTNGQDIEGGVLFVAKGSLDLERVTVRSTHIAGETWGADVYGGVIAAYNGAEVTATHLAVLETELGGHRVEGGVLMAASHASIDVTNGIIAGTDAWETVDTVLGGVVSTGYDSGAISLTNTTLVENTVLHASGGSTHGDTLYVYCGSLGELALHNTDVYGNGTTLEETFHGEGAFGSCHDNVRVSYVNANSGAEWRNFPVDSTPGFLSVEPRYNSPAGPSWDFGLQATSALIDAGDPGLLDADGTRSDIGALGGPGGSAW